MGTTNELSVGRWQQSIYRHFHQQLVIESNQAFIIQAGSPVAVSSTSHLFLNQGHRLLRCHYFPDLLSHHIHVCYPAALTFILIIIAVLISSSLKLKTTKPQFFCLLLAWNARNTAACRLVGTFIIASLFFGHKS